MGSRRDRRWFAEGSHVAPGRQLQRYFRKGAFCEQDCEITEVLLGLAGNVKDQ